MCSIWSSVFEAEEVHNGFKSSLLSLDQHRVPTWASSCMLACWTHAHLKNFVAGVLFLCIVSAYGN